MRAIADDEKDEVAELIECFRSLQARSAAEQNRPISRGVHAKGVCVRGQFQVYDLAPFRGACCAQRLSQGIFARPDSFPAVIRFSNSNSTFERDSIGDVRGMAFRVELPHSGRSAHGCQDYSLQSASTLPFNDVNELLVFTRVFTSANYAVALGALPFREQLVFARIMKVVMQQKRQPVVPYQKLRYWSAAPFRHGPTDIVKYSVWPVSTNPMQPLDVRNPDALREELVRHVREDARMSSFEFGVQFLEADRMLLKGATCDPHFWIDNASVEWPEADSPFYTVAKLTLLPDSVVDTSACEALTIDTSINHLPESEPVGEMNRVRSRVVAASQRARSGAK